MSSRIIGMCVLVCSTFALPSQSIQQLCISCANDQFRQGFNFSQLSSDYSSVLQTTHLETNIAFSNTFFPKQIVEVDLLHSNEHLDSPAASNNQPMLPYSHFTAIPTGQNYKPWLSNSLDTLVASAWSTANMAYTDVKLYFKQKSRIGAVVLFDHSGVFTTNPARIFLQKDSALIPVTVFEGKKFMAFDTIKLIDSIDAEAIVIRKYGNNFPQKIWCYGRPMTTAAPVVLTQLAADKLPVDSNRWFILNYAPGGINALFDGVLNKNPETGYGTFMESYEAWYPLEAGEKMTLTQIKMYDMFGSFASQPATIWVVNENGQSKKVATFNGLKYQTWSGPYPDRTVQNNPIFALDTAVADFKYIVIKCTKNNLPAEIEFLGQYTPPNNAPLPAARKMQPLAQAIGMNAFEWDFVVPSVNSRQISDTKYAPIKTFTGFRHYLDWQRIENTEGSYSFNPAHWGGWSYDMTYERCFRDSIEVLVCMQNVPPWLRNTYPDSLRGTDNSPIKFGLDRSLPISYIEKSRAGFQLAARYGRNKGLDTSLIRVNTLPRWPNDPANQIKIGLGWVKYIECDNEANKWWRGRQGYLSAFEYAAHLSAFYDGHKKTLGAGAGVKNADSTMQVVMMGMADADPSYVRGMVEWCRMNRGYKTDGTVNLCWDVINYHHYTNDKNTNQTGVSTRGLAPELSKAAQLAKEFTQFSLIYCNNMPVWISEAGYDLHQQSTMKAITIGDKTPLLTQADWIMRTALVYMRSGIDRIFFYELNDNNPFSSTKYASMGLVDSLFKRRPAADYLYQMNQLIGKFRYNKTLSASPTIDEYVDSSNQAYAVWIPNEKGLSENVSIAVPNAVGALIYKPVIGGLKMSATWVYAVNGTITLLATETPTIVIPSVTIPNWITYMNQPPWLPNGKNNSTFSTPFFSTK